MNSSYGFSPMIALTCPGAMNPDISKSPTPRRSSMAGGISLCDIRKLKFLGKLLSASSAVIGAVVSNPTAWNVNCFWGSFFAISMASESAYTIRTSAPFALASSSDS